MGKEAVLKVIFGFGVLFFLLYLIGLENIVNSFSGANVQIIILSITILPVVTILHIVRWKMIVNVINNKISFWETVKIYMIGLFFGTITPSKLGEFLKYHYLNKRGISKGTSLSLSLLDRLFDLIIVSVFSVIGIFLVTNLIVLEIESIFIFIFFVLVILAVISMVFNKKIFFKLAGFFIPKLIFLKNIIRVSKKINKNELLEDMYLPFGMLKKNKKNASAIVSISIIIWLILAFQANTVLSSMNEPIALEQMLVIISIVSIIGLIPVTISGIGTREVSFVFLLTLFRIPPNVAVSVSLLLFFITLVLPGVFGGITYVFSNERKIK